MNVFQKINEVKKVVKALTRDAETSGKGAYTFVSGAQILSLIKEKMEEIGLLLLPVETEGRGWKTFNYKNSYGDEKTDFIVDGRIVYEWINCDEPSDRQRIVFDYYGQQNDISKAFGSALTYSERYLLLKSLGAPTDEDDPDNKSTDKKERGKSDNSTPSDGNNRQQGQGARQQGARQQGASQPRGKSKWAQVNDAIKDTGITISQITDWIIEQYGKNLKINDLSDSQFNGLMVAIQQGEFDYE